MKEKGVARNIYLPKVFDKKLEETRKELGLSRSEIIRHALLCFFENNFNKEIGGEVRIRKAIEEMGNDPCEFFDEKQKKCTKEPTAKCNGKWFENGETCRIFWKNFWTV